MIEDCEDNFKPYKEELKKNIKWIHSPETLKRIEDDGFAYMPEHNFFDLCVCKTCHVKVHSWQEFDDPFSYHDLAKHPPNFKDEYLKKKQEREKANQWSIE